MEALASGLVWIMLRLLASFPVSAGITIMVGSKNFGAVCATGEKINFVVDMVCDDVCEWVSVKEALVSGLTDFF